MARVKARFKIKTQLRIRLPKTIHLIGKRFGKLVVIQRDTTTRKSSAAFWLCQCDCGETTIVRGDGLRMGRTHHCGCLRSGTKRKAAEPQGRKPKTNIGDRYGKLTVVSRDLKPTKSGVITWVCQCDCGYTRIARGDWLRKGKYTCCGCSVERKKAGPKAMSFVLEGEQTKYKISNAFLRHHLAIAYETGKFPDAWVPAMEKIQSGLIGRWQWLKQCDTEEALQESYISIMKMVAEKRIKLDANLYAYLTTAIKNQLSYLVKSKRHDANIDSISNLTGKNFESWD